MMFIDLDSSGGAGVPASRVPHQLQGLSGASPEWVDRVVTRLDWLGYVAVLRGPGGEPVTLQITERGMEKVAAKRA